MRVESLSGRLEFNERRARALESVVVYKGDANDVADRDVTSKAETAGPLPPLEPRPLPQAGSHMPSGEGPGQRSRRRRRRRGRRTGPGAAVMMSGQASAAAAGSDAPESASASDSPARDDFKNVSGAAAHRLEPVTAE